MATVLTINGVAVNLDASRTAIQRLTLSVDEPDSLEFGQFGITLPTEWGEGDLVQLAIDGTTYFNGELVSTHAGELGEGPINVGYRAGPRVAGQPDPGHQPPDRRGDNHF